MWTDAQRDGHPAEYRWRPLLNAAKFGPMRPPTARVPCSNAANIGECKLWMQSEFCTCQNCITGKKPLLVYIYSVPAQQTAKHRAKFGWPPLSDVGAVMIPRRKTHLNLLGCHRLPNRSQTLVGRRSPHCENAWRRYCYLTSYFFRLSIHALVAKI